MDFFFTPEQDEAAQLAATILGERATNERQKKVEATGSRVDPELWKDLADAGLISLAVPEAHGGAGLGLVELCRVLVEVGRTVAPVPLAVHGPAAMLVAEFGTETQRAAILPGASSGALLLTAAVAEERAHLPARPTVVARADSAGWRLTGSKAIVRAGAAAGVFLTTAATDEGVGVFLVDPSADGVTRVEQHSSDRDIVVRLD
ncbi:MAG: acyl-CoA dehydrogenase family protein, partial [Nocardioides sp.]